MLNVDWHLNENRTNDDLFCFESDEDDVVLVPKVFTVDEQVARAIASEIQHQRDAYFARGVEHGKRRRSAEFRDLLNAASLEIE